ncbi:hypothetical protein ABBQ32_013669 [Trebouxia sp. C0010 RCD-2024]
MPLSTSRKRALSVPDPAGPEKRKVASKAGNRQMLEPSCSQDIEDTASFAASERKQIRLELLAWYDANHRILPWRRNAYSTRDPKQDDKYQAVPLETPQQQFLYYVWVCEVMSQQTQVPRVAEYFAKWILKWPTVQDLAAASQDQVNDLWAGLGYYRRARLLLEGAQHVQANLSGQIPTTTVGLQEIPGIGPYTGNAIASIAGNEQVAVVDANVVRVLARLRRLAGDQKSKGMVQLNAQLAGSLVDPDRPGCFNQAMMELGACVCTVHQPPACKACPIRGHCRAYAEVQDYLLQGGEPSSVDAPQVLHYPAKAVKAAKRKEDVAVCVVKLLPSGSAPDSASQYLLVQRPDKGLLAGLWEFPSWVVGFAAAPDMVSLGEIVDNSLPELIGTISMSALGSLHIVRRLQLGTVLHTFSHIQQTMHVELLVLQGQLAPDGSGLLRRKVRWVDPQHLTDSGLSSGVKKVWKLVMKKGVSSETDSVA